ncbi:hypothetical protein C2E23DRAFT_463758 [Lenzites betulinus]|nr:hypothetical protein C2E23DRAFT_463758 [Lenzites betulinus]
MRRPETGVVRVSYAYVCIIFCTMSPSPHCAPHKLHFFTFCVLRFTFSRPGRASRRDGSAHRRTVYLCFARRSDLALASPDPGASLFARAVPRCSPRGVPPRVLRCVFTYCRGGGASCRCRVDGSAPALCPLCSPFLRLIAGVMRPVLCSLPRPLSRASAEYRNIGYDR